MGVGVASHSAGRRATAIPARRRPQPVAYCMGRADAPAASGCPPRRHGPEPANPRMRCACSRGCGRLARVESLLLRSPRWPLQPAPRRPRCRQLAGSTCWRRAARPFQTGSLRPAVAGRAVGSGPACIAVPGRPATERAVCNCRSGSSRASCLPPLPRSRRDTKSCEARGGATLGAARCGRPRCGPGPLPASGAASGHTCSSASIAAASNAARAVLGGACVQSTRRVSGPSDWAGARAGRRAAGSRRHLVRVP